MIPPPLNFALFITFLTFFRKLLGLQELVPELDGPIYKGIFSDICLLLSVL
jgi:hypothetical protein